MRRRRIKHGRVYSGHNGADTNTARTWFYNCMAFVGRDDPGTPSRLVIGTRKVEIIQCVHDTGKDDSVIASTSKSKKKTNFRNYPASILLVVLFVFAFVIFLYNNTDSSSSTLHVSDIDNRSVNGKPPTSETETSDTPMNAAAPTETSVTPREISASPTPPIKIITEAANETATGTATGMSTGTETETITNTSSKTAAASLTDIVISEEAYKLLNTMTLQEKIHQLLFVTPEALTGVTQVTQAGPATQKSLALHPVGGIIYFKGNIKSKEQISVIIKNAQAYSKIPLFIGVDEEGGRVTRISNRFFSPIDPMKIIGDSGDPNNAYRVGEVIAVDASTLPASLSSKVVTGFLKNELNFKKIIITDSMSMDAVLNNYPAGEAAVLSLLAGADMLLCPSSIEKTVQGIEGAVESGRITEKRIDESVVKILQVKIDRGIIIAD